MPSIAQSKLLLEAAESYANAIDEATLDYLAGRGISETQAARYRLGTIVEPINGHENYRGWLSIPYITALGLCVGFKFRRLDDSKPKYGSPLGQKSHLYNVSDLILDVGSMVICEGELDALILSSVCNLSLIHI